MWVRVRVRVGARVRVRIRVKLGLGEGWVIPKVAVVSGYVEPLCTVTGIILRGSRLDKRSTAVLPSLPHMSLSAGITAIQ